MKMQLKTNVNARKELIRSTLLKLPVKQLGSNFLVIASIDFIPIIMEVAKSLGMVHPFAQWLYAISDTDGNDDLIRRLSPLIVEGDNIAFVYNFTSNIGTDCTVSSEDIIITILIIIN